MKLSLDTKFVVTAAATFLVLVTVLAVLSYFVGLAAAAVGATITGAVAVKLFDRLEYTPSKEIEFGAPLVSVPWLYAAIASVFLMKGSWIGAEILLNVADTPANQPCSNAMIFWMVALDWGSFVASGWLIGRLFPAHALSAATLAGVVITITTLLDPDLRDPEKTKRMLLCLLGEAPTPEEMPGVQGDVRTWSIVGMVLRAYVALVIARIAARRTLRTAEPKAV